MAKNRYIGDYPAIGIRPIVYGRCGPLQVRAGLEPQVWAMANAAKKLFEENLFYSNGEPVRVVLAVLLTVLAAVVLVWASVCASILLYQLNDPVGW